MATEKERRVSAAKVSSRTDLEETSDSATSDSGCHPRLGLSVISVGNKAIHNEAVKSP